MPLIRLETIIDAPIERVFDLSRSIDFHKLSVAQTNEKAIAGKTTGLIDLGETVTWRAKHFGIYQTLTVQITAFDRPHMFEDVMIKGIFKSMRHIHHFEELIDGTKMTDFFEYISPFGVLGKLVDVIILKKYMKKFLLIRNRALKEVAESNSWRDLLHSVESIK